MCSIPQHTNLWGNVPNQVDRSVSANTERMRILRNEYGHTTDFFLSDSDFEQKWKDIFQIVKELESNLGTATDHQDALLKLKTCSMDPDEEKKYIQKLSIVEQMQVQISDLEGKGYSCDSTPLYKTVKSFLVFVTPMFKLLCINI